MGVLTDYFRAPEDVAVQRALRETDGGPLVDGPGAAFNGVSANGMDPILLDSLLGCVDPDGEQDTVGIIVWPMGAPPAGHDPGPDSPWATGPWVTRLSDRIRDILAEIDDGDVEAVVTDWVETEALRELGARKEDVEPLVVELIGLARAARAAHEQLYSWVSL